MTDATLVKHLWGIARKEVHRQHALCAAVYSKAEREDKLTGESTRPPFDSSSGLPELMTGICVGSGAIPALWAGARALTRSRWRTHVMGVSASAVDDAEDSLCSRRALLRARGRRLAQVGSEKQAVLHVSTAGRCALRPRRTLEGVGGRRGAEKRGGGTRSWGLEK